MADETSGNRFGRWLRNRFSVTRGPPVPPAPVAAAPVRLLHAIDEPVLWRVPGPAVTISGWCLAERPAGDAKPAAPLAVRARLAGRAFAARPTVRPDVAAAFPARRGAAEAGFSVEVVALADRSPVVLEAEVDGAWREFFREEIVVDAAAALPGARRYAEWAARFDTPAAAHLQELARAVETFPRRPQFRILLLGDTDAAHTTASLQAQIWRGFAVASGDAPGAAEGADGWVVAVQAGDLLPPHALARLAAEIVAHPEARWIYSDEDVWRPGGLRSDPWFKPDWDPDLHCSLDYLGRLAAVRADVFAAARVQTINTWSDWWALARRAAATLRAEEIRHVPHVLYHRGEPGPELAPVADEPARGAAEPKPAPLVSVVIPTRDRAELLRRCVAAVVERTDYAPLEFLLVDHATSEPAARAALDELARDPRVRRVRVADGPFNFSALVNAGVAASRGEIVVLLNNDVEPLDGGWLAPLVAAALEPAVGCVGARLEYPDGRIQHAGIALGVHGAAGLPFRGLPGDTRDRAGRAWATRRVAAVTAACLAVRRAVWDAAGGFDAAALPVSFNDVDFCLRVAAAGLHHRVLAEVRLRHHESVTRGGPAAADPQAAAEFATLRGRWAARLAADPAWSPNLTVDSEEATPAFPPRVPPAWAVGGARTAEAAERDAQLAVRKREEAERFRAELATWLAAETVLEFPAPAEPAVSVLVVTHNRAELTWRCLRALRATVGASYEVVIVDNASADETGRLLARIRGATILRNAENRNFLLAANQAAAAARGRQLLFLNNDAEVAPEALARAVAVLEEDPRTGAVGAQLLWPDGRLQEAGSVVWGDGRTQGTGRGGDPTRPEFNFRRPVDYVAGAFLLTPRARFAELGGFDERFVPAYYEEADYCARLWQCGYRVLYEPTVRVRHQEFATASAVGASALQERNRAKFAAKHADWLAGRPVAGAAAAARWHTAGPARARVLVLEDRIPQPHLGAGFPRTLALVRTLVELDCRVTVAALRVPPPALEEIYTALPRTVEIADVTDGLASFLAERLGCFDTLIVCRPDNFRAVTALRARTPALLAGWRLMYDAEAVFARRTVSRAVAEAQPPTEAEVRTLIDRELAPAAEADVVLAVAPAEAEEFRAHGARRVEVLSHAHAPVDPAQRPPWAARRGLLFVGSFHADAAPNADALVWFVGRVLPLLPETIALRVVGEVASAAVRRLASPRVVLAGRVPDLQPEFDAARVFVAPTRFGAGIPHKVTEAAAGGIPIVMTPLLAGQLGWTNGAEARVAGEAAAFAAAIRRLHDDAAAWQRVRDGALAAVRRDFSPERFRATLERVL